MDFSLLHLQNSLTEDTQAPSMLWVESGSDSADHMNGVFFYLKKNPIFLRNFTSVPSSTTVYLQSQWRSAGHSVISHGDVRERAADRGGGESTRLYKSPRQTRRAAFGV